MKELFMLMATITPADVIIEQLEEAIDDYKILKDKDSKNKILMNCHMLLMNHMTDGSTNKMSEILKDMSQQEERNKIFDINNLS